MQFALRKSPSVQLIADWVLPLGKQRQHCSQQNTSCRLFGNGTELKLKGEAHFPGLILDRKLSSKPNIEKRFDYPMRLQQIIREQMRLRT